MAILLAAGINATQNRVTLTEPLTAAPGDLFRIGNEVVEFGGYGRMAGGRLVDHSRKIVSFGRGVNGTTAATHTATTAVLRVVDGLVSAVGAPDPFVAAGGASAHGDLTGVTSDQHHAQLHAAAHAEGEADEITPAAIGAAPAAAPATLPRASYSGGAVSVANNGGGPGHEELTWDTLGSGDALLDLTDPERPAVLAGGIYSVTAVAAAGELLTAGGMFMAVLHFDLLDQDAICEMTSGAGNADQFALVSVNNTFYIPADGVITVAVFNFDGAVTRSFSLREAIIQAIALDPA